MKLNRDTVDRLVALLEVIGDPTSTITPVVRGEARTLAVSVALLKGDTPPANARTWRGPSQPVFQARARRRSSKGP